MPDEWEEVIITDLADEPANIVTEIKIFLQLSDQPESGRYSGIGYFRNSFIPVSFTTPQGIRGSTRDLEMLIGKFN